MTDDAPRVLVAGVGNIFLGDDGFGVEVANRLAAVPMPENVHIADYGIRGVHLAYELLEGYDALVLIDALPMSEAPGTVAVIEPDMAALTTRDDDVAPAMDAHSMNPGVVLGMLGGLGGTVDLIRVVGCEPATIEEGIGLSAPVAAAVDDAVSVVTQLVEEISGNAGRGART
jgi:hydrogenase maturation protease